MIAVFFSLCLRLLTSAYAFSVPPGHGLLPFSLPAIRAGRGVLTIPVKMGMQPLVPRKSLEYGALWSESGPSGPDLPAQSGFVICSTTSNEAGQTRMKCTAVPVLNSNVGTEGSGPGSGGF